MIQRLFFNRVNAKARALAIGREHHFAVAVLSHEAKAAVTGFQATRPWTKIANHAVALDLMPPATGQRSVATESRVDWSSYRSHDEKARSSGYFNVSEMTAVVV